MKKFEYKKERIGYYYHDSSNIDKMEISMLQKEGLLGWELVAVTRINDTSKKQWTNEYYLKREVYNKE